MYNKNEKRAIHMINIKFVLLLSFIEVFLIVLILEIRDRMKARKIKKAAHKLFDDELDRIVKEIEECSNQSKATIEKDKEEKQ